MKKLPILAGKKLLNHILSHVDKRSKVESRSSSSTFYTVNKPMHVFKKAYWGESSHVIVNLVIPVGARIYVDNNVGIDIGHAGLSHRKMRASEAFVHSIVLVHSHKQVKTARAGYFSWFKYHVGKKVFPDHFEAYYFAQCAGGIHFFVNLQDALSW